MGLLDNIGNKLSVMSDDDKRGLALGLASGFAGMSGNPNTNSIMAGIAGQQAALRDDRKAAQAKDLATQQAANQRNRTATFLRSKGDQRFSDLADALESQQISGADAWSEYQRLMKFDDRERKTFTDAYGDIRYLDGNKELVMGGAAPTQVMQGSVFERNSGTGAIPTKRYTTQQSSKIDTLSDDIRTGLKDFNMVADGWDRLSLFFENKGAVSDYSLAVGFAKILDPTSVARQSEVDAIAQSSSIGASMKAALTKAVKGEGAMPPALRTEIAELARGIYVKKANKAKTKLDKYEASANRFGIDLQDIYFGSDITIPAEIKPDLSIYVPKNVPPAIAKYNGMTQDEWEAMPRDEKEKLITLMTN